MPLTCCSCASVALLRSIFGRRFSRKTLFTFIIFEIISWFRICNQSEFKIDSMHSTKNLKRRYFLKSAAELIHFLPFYIEANDQSLRLSFPKCSLYNRYKIGVEGCFSVFYFQFQQISESNSFAAKQFLRKKYQSVFFRKSTNQ